MKKFHFLIKNRPDNEAKVQAIMLQSRPRLYWIKNGKTYHWHCSQCGSSGDVDKKRMTQIRNSELCPECYNRLRVTHTKEAYIKCYVLDINEGYECSGQWDMFTGWSNMQYYHCLHIEDGKEYKRGIARTINGCIGQFGRYGGRDDAFTKAVTRSPYQIEYYNYFYTINTFRRTYREYLEGLAKEPCVLSRDKLKSNQYTLICNGHYNADQIKGIIKFDLKTDDEVQKYSKYLNANSGMSIIRKYNVYVLDYLNRNKIFPVDYDDYAEQCEQLGIKLDKPKDFATAHANLSKEIQMRQNAENDELIRARLSDISKFEYNCKNFAVKAFTGYENLLEVANTLHNCMASNFSKPYANGITDIFYGTINDEIAFGIEVKDKKLMQLRGPRNEHPTPEVERFVKKWCKQYEISYQ